MVNMQYIKIDNDTWIQYDPLSLKSNVVKKSILEEQLLETQEQLDSRPELSNEDLIAYATQQKFFTDRLKEREILLNKVDEINNTLTELV